MHLPGISIFFDRKNKKTNKHLLRFIYYGFEMIFPLGLFIDIGDNFTTLELSCTNFAYDEIDETDPAKEDIPNV